MNKREEQKNWMAIWCADNGLRLELKGECGIMRECVGVLGSDVYPDYEWFDKDYNRVDANGEVWIPEGAYHKHPCVAVLGRGEHAEEQLYQWLKWFDANGFKYKTGSQPVDPALGKIAYMMGQHRYHRMVKQ